MRYCMVVSVAGLFCSLVCADIVHLKDGSKVDGDLHRTDVGWDVKTADGSVVSVDESNVERVEMARSRTSAGGPVTPPADDPLSAVRKMAENQSDLNVIITRYEQLLKQLGNSPLASEARKDMELWQSRKAAGMVKMAGRWAAKGDSAAIDARVLELTEQALAAIKGSKLTDAGRFLDDALILNSADCSSLYLKGLVFLKQNNNFGLARKSFEAALVAAPEHGPTLNNAAIMEWRQRAYAIAATNFEKALIAMPLDVILHDNIAEVLHDPPREVERAPVFARLRDRWNQTEPQVQQTMAQKGLSRWGSVWVDAQKLKAIKEEQQRVQSEMDKLQKEYDAAEKRIKAIGEKINSNDYDMSQIKSNRTTRDAQGRMIQTGVPQIYYDMERENDSLKRERKDLQDSLAAMRGEAPRLEKQMPQPPYTGLLRPMDEDMMPIAAGAKARPPMNLGAVAAPAAATTLPAPAPAGPSTAPAIAVEPLSREAR